MEMRLIFKLSSTSKFRDFAGAEICAAYYPSYEAAFYGVKSAIVHLARNNDDFKENCPAEVGAVNEGGVALGTLALYYVEQGFVTIEPKPMLITEQDKYPF